MVHFKVVDSITRPFISTSEGWNLQQDDVLKELNDDLAEHMRQLPMVVDPQERTAIINEMTAIRNQITALLTIERGTFAPPISLL